METFDFLNFIYYWGSDLVLIKKNRNTKTNALFLVKSFLVKKSPSIKSTSWQEYNQKVIP